MKRLICVGLALLCLTAGCGAVGPAEEHTTVAEPVVGTTTVPQEKIVTTQKESVPRPDYEFTEYFAKTPTHIFATRGGKPFEHGNELYRMPLGDISRQEKIALPGQFDEIAICGLSEQWLFVSTGQTVIDEGSSYPRLLSAVTYRISLKTLKSEQVDECLNKSPKYGIYPRYNAGSDSLLYIRDSVVEALPLGTENRNEVFDFSDQYNPASDAHVRGWANTPDGPSLEILGDWWDGPFYCIVFDSNNIGRVMDREDMLKYAQPEPNKVEEELKDHNYSDEQITFVYSYATCGNYVYYVEESYSTKERNLYRVKLDGTGKELLRKNTNIFSLMEVNDKLFCLAHWPEDSEGMGFYSLDEKGQLLKVIDTGWSGEWAWYGWERFGEFIMFYFEAQAYAEKAISSLYSPLTGATFYAYEK